MNLGTDRDRGIATTWYLLLGTFPLSCTLYGLQIIHPLLQIGIESPCEKMDCSHMCILAPGPKGVCKCPSGLLLAKDGLTCSTLVNSAFLLMLSPSTVTQVLLQFVVTLCYAKNKLTFLQFNKFLQFCWFFFTLL